MSTINWQSTVPKVSPKSTSLAKTSEQTSKHSVSWHRDAVKFHALSACILVALLVCVSLCSANGGLLGITELYTGQCSRAKVIDQCMQLVWAITAIGMSVSLDFFIRLVSSPTIADLRKAHSQGRSLDVGIPSFRNLRQLSPWRKLCWVSLVTIGIPIQLFFHSSTFIVYTSTTYSTLIASEAFTAGADFVYPGVAFKDPTAFESTTGIESQFHDILPGFRAASTNWTRLEVQDCQRTYFQDPTGLQSHRNLLLVVQAGPDADAKGWKGAQVWKSTPPAYTNDTIHEYKPEAVNALWSISPICITGRSRGATNDIYTVCSHRYPTVFLNAGRRLVGDLGTEHPQAWNISWSDGFKNDQMYPEYRTVAVKYCLSEPYSAPCKAFVSGPFLLISLICVFIGSIVSALVSSSAWLEESCQCLGDALKLFMTHDPDLATDFGTGPLMWTDTKRLWGQVVSRRMWLWTYTPVGLFLVGGLISLCKFGVSMLASLYSTLFQGKYWADFAVKAQQLRVSLKHGALQVSTHIFQFPLLWGVSFICLKALLGWILTQILYVMPIGNVSFWQPEFEFDDVDVYIGYSFRAMIPGLVIAAVAAAIPVILSCRRLPTESVVVGTDSALIASYCPPKFNTPSNWQDEGFDRQRDPGAQLENLMRSRRDIGRLRWGVLDLGSERNGRPGVLGLGTEDEVINVSPIAGHKYISVASASDGVNHSYLGEAAGW